MTMMVLLQELRQHGITVSSHGESLKIQAPQGKLTADLRARLAIHKADMLRWLQELNQAEESALPTCVPDLPHRYEPFPLSDMQLGFYMGDDPYMEFHVRPHYYIEKNVVALDVTRYEAAWNKALARHKGEIVTVQPDGQIIIVRDPAPLHCKVQDLRQATPDEVQLTLGHVRGLMMRSELPLKHWPWVELRVTLWMENGIEQARIHYNHNNFFSDGFGTTRLLQEIDTYYRNPEIVLPPLTLTFRDAAVTLDTLAQSPAGKAAQRYWEQRLDNLPGPPALPVRAKLNRRCRSRLERREGFIPAATWSAFKARAAHFGITPSNAVFCAYAEILSAWGNSPHFVLSNMMTRRLNIHPEIRDIIGNFASLYPLEVDFRQENTFVERARNLQEQVIRDAKHLQWGGMQVMQALNRRKGSLGTAAIPFVVGSGLFMEGFERSDFSCLETSQVMLDHQFWELADGSFYYVWDLLENFFPAGLIDSMWHAYRQLIGRLATEESLWQSHILDLSPAAMLQARASICPPAKPLSPCTLLDFLADTVRVSPEQAALVSVDRVLTYRDLDSASSSIARVLLDTAKVRDNIVAIVADRGEALFKAVYAVLKAGAAYVPIDPSLPEERRNYILANCEAAAVLAQQQYAQTLRWPESIPVLSIEQTEIIWPSLRSDGEAAVGPADLAYLIYTSGSTGYPKGVMIEHSGVVNTVLDVNQRFEVGHADRLFGVSSFGFDLSVYDLFGCVAAGAVLVYPDPAQSLNPSHWLDVVQEQCVTVWNSAPPLASLLVETAESRGVCLPHLRLVMLSGDWIPLDLPDRIRRLAPGARVVSLGGATEASIWSISYEIATVDPAWTSIPYGYPMQNQPWYVLDAWGREVPEWTAGELYIGGVGLARGYWKDQDKTAASFVFHPISGERIYRTGDIGRYVPGGVIEFLGRKDTQVKIYGHRIELGEIESVLLANTGVSAAVAEVQTSTAGNVQLVAYVVPVSGCEVEAEALRALLAKKLPDYMVPRAIQVLERLPLSSNGKVDRKALPRINAQQAAPGIKCMRVPNDETEIKLLAIWRGILGRQELGVADDFFEMGGQSFEAVRIIGAVREAFGVSLSLGEIWQARSVERVAALIREGTSAAHSGYLLELRPHGANLPLFLVHPAGGHVMCYRGLAGLLDRPSYAFQAPGLEGQGAALESIETLAALYVSRLELEQPDGPVLLGGWSSGALIAFEMAVQLRHQGRAVAGVVLIDCPAPLPETEPEATPGITPRKMPGKIIDEKVLLGWFLEDLALDLPVAQLLASVTVADTAARQQLQQVFSLLQGSGREIGLDLETLTEIYQVFSGIVRGSRQYAGALTDVDLLLIRANNGIVSEFAGHPFSASPDWGWSAFSSGSVSAEAFAGSHYTLLTAPSISGLAKTMESWFLSRE